MEENKKSNVKKIIIISVIAVAVIIIAIVANKQVKKYTAKRKLKEALDKISETISNTPTTIGGKVSDTTSSDIKDDTQKQYAEVNIGQTINIDDYLEYSFVDTNFTKKIEPSNPDSYYHYYEAKSSDNIMLAVKTKIKNLGTEEFDGEKIPKATMLYDGKYKYNCNLIVEDDDGGDLNGYDWYMDIEPLKSKNFYYYAELPQEARDDGKTLTLRIDLKGNSYELKIR